MAGALIGALRVSLSAETTAFEAGMKRSQRQAATTASSIQNSFKRAGGAIGLLKSGVAGFVGALSVGTVIAAVKAGLDYAGSLAEVAQQLGVTTKQLQVYRFAAGQVGVSQDQLETGLSKLNVSLGKAKLGAKAPAAAFAELSRLIGKDIVASSQQGGDALPLVADGLAKITDRSKRAAVEVALFARSGALLDPLLSGGSAAINELAIAAEKLGIVLSDEQIRKADETADKLEALQTVLKTRIAGAVADNSDSVLGLADAFGGLVKAIADASRELDIFFAKADVQIYETLGRHADAARARGSVFRSDRTPSIPGSSVTIKLPPATGPAVKPEGVDIAPFLGGGGSKKKSREDHSAEQALRDQFQFDQQLRRANIDILQAKRSLASDYSEQASIAIQIKDAERAEYEAELEYEVALNRLTKGKQGLNEAQAAQLIAAYDQKDALERQAILEEEQAQRKEEFNRLDQVTFDLQRDRLQAELQIAETAEEQRAIQLRLLDLSYRQERARLEAVIADEKASFAAKEEARRRLENLTRTYSFDRASVIANTRGPMEDYLASLPTTAAKLNEAMERLQVEGFDGLIDSVLALSEGVGAATDSLLATLKAFLLGLARLELQRMLGNTLQQGGGLGGIIGSIGSLFGGSGGTASSISSAASNFLSSGGLPGFAGGGSFNVLGNVGRDRNILSLNMRPIARVDYGERINIGNDNSPTRSRGGRGDVTMFVNTPDADSFRKSEGQITRALRRKLA